MPSGGTQGYLAVARETQRALARKILDLCSEKSRYVPTAEMMRALTGTLSISDGWRKQTLRMIDAAEEGGYINKPQFLVPWKRSIWNQFNIASQNSAQSETLFETAYTYLYPNAGIENFWRTNPYWFVKELAVEGQAGIISGDRGYGKTDHALYLCELLIGLKQDQRSKGANSHFAQIRSERRYRERFDQMAVGDISKKEEGGPFSAKMGLYDSDDIRFPTNISIAANSPYAEYFQQAAKMSEFVRLMCENALKNTFSLVVPDEMGFSFNKRRTMSSHNFGIEQILIIIRKFNAGMFAIAQSAQGQLPPSLTESAQTKIQKLSKTTATYDIRGLGVLQRIRNIPHTSIRYATRAFASFALDIDPQLMVTVVAEQEQLARRDGVEWTDKMMYEATLDWLNTSGNVLTAKEVAEGKSGILRGQVRHMANTTDPDTMKPYTPEKIAQALSDDHDEISVDTVVKILKETREQEKSETERRRKRSAPPEVLAA